MRVTCYFNIKYTHYIYRCKGNQECKDFFRRSVIGCSICPFCCLPDICFSIHPAFLSIFRFVSDLHFVWHGSSACCHNSHGIHSELNREQTSVPCHDQSSVISTCVVHCIMYNKLHVHVVKCTLTCCHDQSYLISTSVVQWRLKKHRTLLWWLDELDHREHSICIRI